MSVDDEEITEYPNFIRRIKYQSKEIFPDFDLPFAIGGMSRIYQVDDHVCMKLSTASVPIEYLINLGIVDSYNSNVTEIVLDLTNIPNLETIRGQFDMQNGVRQHSMEYSYRAFVEAIVLQKLTRHPNIVQFHQMRLLGDGIDNSKFQIASFLEKVGNGYTLQNEIEYISMIADPIEKLSRIKYVLDNLEGIADALDTINALDPPVRHRDLKPSNILLDMNINGQINIAKLADFGLAILGDETGDNLSLFSPLYVAPESLPVLIPLPGVQYGLHKNTDQYSFGIILTELLAGNMVINRYAKCKKGDKEPNPQAMFLAALTGPTFTQNLEVQLAQNLGISMDNAISIGQALRVSGTRNPELRMQSCKVLLNTIREALESANT